MTEIKNGWPLGDNGSEFLSRVTKRKKIFPGRGERIVPSSAARRRSKWSRGDHAEDYYPMASWYMSRGRGIVVSRNRWRI